MSNIVIAVSFCVVAMIHLLPIVGVVGAEKLNVLCGLSISDPGIELLMRLRAVLFGILGLLFGATALVPALTVTALLAGLASVVSFFVLAQMMPDYGDGIRKIVIAGSVALAALAFAAVTMAVA